jgi:hypothetical protein
VTVDINVRITLEHISRNQWHQVQGRLTKVALSNPPSVCPMRSAISSVAKPVS